MCLVMVVYILASSNDLDMYLDSHLQGSFLLISPGSALGILRSSQRAISGISL